MPHFFTLGLELELGLCGTHWLQGIYPNSSSLSILGEDVSPSLSILLVFGL